MAHSSPHKGLLTLPSIKPIWEYSELFNSSDHIKHWKLSDVLIEKCVFCVLAFSRLTKHIANYRSALLELVDIQLLAQGHFSTLHTSLNACLNPLAPLKEQSIQNSTSKFKNLNTQEKKWCEGGRHWNTEKMNPQPVMWLKKNDLVVW